MHTDAFGPEELRLHKEEDWNATPPRSPRDDVTTQTVDAVSDETQPVETPDDDTDRLRHP